MPGASVRRGRAFAPAHVSGIFAPRLEARDPRGRGSVGAGLVLGVGVHASAEWRPASRPSLRLTADVPTPLGISETVARRLLARGPGHLDVHLHHAVPVGQGFGSSAAGALATGLAVARALELPRERAVEVAHLADLFGGGGLGGVAAILGGGLEVRVAPGIPPLGRVIRRALDRVVVVGTVGPPLRSPAILGDPALLRRFADAAAPLARLVAAPSWERFWDASETFTDEVGLAPAGLTAVIRGLRRRGARAAQAMFGQSFFATVPEGASGTRLLAWLMRERLAFRLVRVGRLGARALVPGTKGRQDGERPAARARPRRGPARAAGGASPVARVL